MSMKLTYDKEADAIYIELQDGMFARNKKVDDFTILDLDEKGHILGIEILEASKRIPKRSLTHVQIKNLIVDAS